MSDIEAYDSVFLVEVGGAGRGVPYVEITSSPQPGAIPVSVVSSVSGRNVKVVAVGGYSTALLYILNPRDIPPQLQHYLK